MSSESSVEFFIFVHILGKFSGSYGTFCIILPKIVVFLKIFVNFAVLFEKVKFQTATSHYLKLYCNNLFSYPVNKNGNCSRFHTIYSLNTFCHCKETIFVEHRNKCGAIHKLFFCRQAVMHNFTLAESI